MTEPVQATLVPSVVVTWMYAVDGSVPSTAGAPPITNGVNARVAAAGLTRRSIECENGSGCRGAAACAGAPRALGAATAASASESVLIVPIALTMTGAWGFVGMGHPPEYEPTASRQAFLPNAKHPGAAATGGAPGCLGVS